MLHQHMLDELVTLRALSLLVLYEGGKQRESEKIETATTEIIFCANSLMETKSKNRLKNFLLEFLEHFYFLEQI
jgi:hypothetical protein